MTTVAALESSAALDQILPALLAAQAQIGPAPKGAKNPHFQSRYADLSDVLEVCRGPLLAHAIAILNPVRPLEDGKVEISCVLLHASTQWVRSRIVLAANVLKPQEIGSALTYYRRYLLAALLSVATEDDDGAAASRPVPATPAGVTPRGLMGAPGGYRAEDPPAGAGDPAPRDLGRMVGPRVHADQRRLAGGDGHGERRGRGSQGLPRAD